MRSSLEFSMKGSIREKKLIFHCDIREYRFLWRVKTVQCMTRVLFLKFSCFCCCFVFLQSVQWIVTNNTWKDCKKNVSLLKSNIFLYLIFSLSRRVVNAVFSTRIPEKIRQKKGWIWNHIFSPFFSVTAHYPTGSTQTEEKAKRVFKMELHSISVPSGTTRQ